MSVYYCADHYLICFKSFSYVNMAKKSFVCFFVVNGDIVFLNPLNHLSIFFVLATRYTYFFVILISLTYSKKTLQLVVEFLHQMASLKALFSCDCHLLPFLTPAFQKFSQSVAELKRSCLICHLDKFILAP